MTRTSTTQKQRPKKKSNFTRKWFRIAVPVT